MADTAHPNNAASVVAPPRENATESNANANGLLAAPTWVNYGRVVADIVMAAVLVCVVVSGISGNKEVAGKSLHVHEMPIYRKSRMDFSSMWSTAHKGTASEAAKLTAFKAKAVEECITIANHPMCSCIAVASSDVMAKNCLLHHPTPSINSDWNIGAVSPALVLWFLASLATSIGTLPIINSYVTQVSSEQPESKAHVIIYSKFVCAFYAIITLCAVIVPIIITAILFPGDSKHMDSMLVILSYSVAVLAALIGYNYETIGRYFTFSLVEQSATEKQKSDTMLLHMSMNNWMLYVHLLVSAPAIATVLHITQQWTEHHTMVNTTLVLSTIFAVDAFSVEMANFWVHRATSADHLKPEALNDVIRKNILDMHTRLGLIRLFAWVVNAVMLLLLFTLAYPVEVEQQRTNSAVFVVIVIAFAGVFLAPDLVREFTHRVSFNSIQFRLYGDFMLRALVLFFVWRASVVERT